MAEAALFISWGQPVRGREKRASKQMRDSVRYWQRLQAEGRIERFDWAGLSQQGGDLWGFALLRGTDEQINSLRRSEEFGRNILRVSLVADRVAVVDATVDEELLARDGRAYEETVEELD